MLDEALRQAWTLAGSGQLPAAARQAHEAVAATQRAGMALQPAQQILLDLLEGTVQLMHGHHESGLARVVPALAGIDAAAALPISTRAGHSAAPAWAC